MVVFILGQLIISNKSGTIFRTFFSIKESGVRLAEMALKTLTSIRRRLDNATIYSIDTWYPAFSLSPDVTVLGYLVRLDALQPGALKAVDNQLDRRLREILTTSHLWKVSLPAPIQAG